MVKQNITVKSLPNGKELTTAQENLKQVQNKVISKKPHYDVKLESKNALKLSTFKPVSLFNAKSLPFS